MRARAIYGALLLASFGTSALAEGEEDAETEVAAPEAPLPALGLEDALERADRSRRAEFARGSYEWCHDPEWRPRYRVDAVRFCKVFGDSSVEVCPNARNLCEGRTPRSSRRFEGLSIPRWLAWGIVLAFVVVVLGAAIRAYVRAGWDREDRPDLGGEEVDLATLQSLPEASAQLILRRATAALEQGEILQAALLAHLACLRYLDDTGLAAFHPSKTNGDYLRSIRRHPPIAAVFKAIAAQTDRARFFDGQTDEAAVRAAIGDAERAFQRRPQTGGAAVLGAVLLLVAGCDVSEGRPPWVNFSPVGMGALPRVLREAGLEVKVSSAALDKLPPATGLVVMRTSASYGRPLELSLDAPLDEGLTVLVIDDDERHAASLLPAITTTIALGATGRVEVADALACGVPIADVADRIDPIELPLGAEVHLDEARSSASVSAYTLEVSPLLSYESRGPAAFAFDVARLDADNSTRSGCLIVFTNGDLFTNASLTRASNAAFVVALFGGLVSAGETIVFLDSIGESVPKADSATRGLAETHLLPLIGQATLWLVALLLAMGVAFGPLRDPEVVEHKAFVEHVEAIGRHYAAAGTRGRIHAAGALARFLVLRHRHEVRGAHGWRQVAAQLAAKHGVEEPLVRAALRLGIEGVSELGAPGLDDPDPGSHVMLRTLSTLLGPSDRTKGAS